MFVLLAYLIGFKICLFSGYFSWRVSHHFLAKAASWIKVLAYAGVIALPTLAFAAMLPRGRLLFTGAALLGTFIDGVMRSYQARG